MNAQQKTALASAMQDRPLVAILRGISPEEVEAVGDALVEAGFKMIEVPLNSPRPWQSLERLVKRMPEDVLVGAGTVLDVADVERLGSLGASLLITPNIDADIVEAGKAQELASFIGCMTPSEALMAARSGATALKLFPAARLGVGYFSDVSAILPSDLPVFAVGGVNRDNMADWHAAGVRGFGFGSNLYQPGRHPDEVGTAATSLVAEWQRLEALAAQIDRTEREEDA
ncbi:2-dehydro-3-deoxy-6-phosphogalactonate aldolase [Aidingimonas halophila]|uniref:2-keto-3-deoxy-phosphogalactonate aldolase n=1 Tax=Aidingimonas halophila TaxID=574349 RepID=A0A1H2RZR4_9GAMM|nr:2-dehydro-3-deoxy-6-phosphogalactonate aldolase [Aidingimonas halophila]GHC18469.1 2-dehydro-3-deoxy-6-phosphogalactonate aldolase [Aidingimonas halophila]SDW24926.1 2-keto-3-deoxy-phosphogalactonate aldolase [Aidingimonas halophila]